MNTTSIVQCHSLCGESHWTLLLNMSVPFHCELLCGQVCTEEQQYRYMDYEQEQYWVGNGLWSAVAEYFVLCSLYLTTCPAFLYFAFTSVFLPLNLAMDINVWLEWGWPDNCTSSLKSCLVLTFSYSSLDSWKLQRDKYCTYSDGVYTGSNTNSTTLWSAFRSARADQCVCVRFSFNSARHRSVSLSLSLWVTTTLYMSAVHNSSLM